MIIKVLTENTAVSSKFKAEHGLSLYIETNGHKILFDTGQTDAFAYNAKALGIDLSDIDIAVLSHGHYDHGGGIIKFTELNSKAKIYMNRYAFQPYYNGTEKYIGLDLSLQNCERIVFVDDVLTLDKGLVLKSCNENDYTCDSCGLNVKQNGEFIPDKFRHEQYLEVTENDKKILISGCSHKGILNIVKWFEPDYLVGGFHFMKIEDDKLLERNAKALSEFNTTYFTCHCTGVEQYEFLKKLMRDKLNYISCGQEIIL